VYRSPTEINPPYNAVAPQKGDAMYIEGGGDSVQVAATPHLIGYCENPIVNGMIKMYRPIGG